MQPRTQYARSGDLNIAYQVVGDGPIDLVFTFGWASHLDFQWADPNLTRFLRGLARFSRVLVFDKRGVGLSDPVTRAPTIEERMDDIRAVMDAAGSERAALIGYSEGGAMSALYAAAHPERTVALVMYETWVSGLLDPDRNPAGQKWLAVDRDVRRIIDHWGEGVGLDYIAPGLEPTDLDRAAYGSFERAAMSPGMAKALWESFVHADVTAVLPTISVPTLILHHTDSHIPVEHARYAAEHIPGARLLELDGTDHAPLTHDAHRIAGEIEEFLTGTRSTETSDRVLATVLFTDIVGSTERAAALGDPQWLALLKRHDAIVRANLARFDGEEVRHTGDGFLATFDRPGRAVRCAFEVRAELEAHDIPIRAGLHTGECERQGSGLGGLAFHVGARVLGSAADGEILVSRAVKDLVYGSGVELEDRGTHELRGVPGEWPLYAVASVRDDTGPTAEELAPVRPRVNDRIMRTAARRTPALIRSAASLRR
jgi:pimeloyl-ACP methyl ester carboxylesterase